MKLLILIFLATILLAQNILKPYSTDGKILQITISELEKNKVHKKALVVNSKKYYEKNKLYLEYINTAKDSVIVKQYYKSGQIHLIIHYTSGIKHGFAKVYYEDGTLAAAVSYSQDKMDGKYDEYYTNGKLHYQKYFSNGILDGPIIVYDDTGNKSYQLDDENSREVCY